MHNWNYTPNRSISLPLAADARLGQTSYINDHIWEFKLGDSDPPAISLETTFGLRARLCRIFPRFIQNGTVINDPAHFLHPITIHQYHPNYLQVSFKPFSTINVKLEYWVPGSQIIANRTTLTNTSREACDIQLEWAELLLPSPNGSRMATNEIEMTTTLSGNTGDLAPVLFLTGGAKPAKSPFPSLTVSYHIPPHAKEESRWVHAALADTNSSYNLTKEVINKNWNADFARITRVNSQQLEIYTGNNDWNTALFLSQNIAYQLIMNPTQNSHTVSFVTTRKPDQGYSLRKDGSEYNHLWNGQTPLDTYYLTNFLLPSSPELVRGILDNFLDAQTTDGEIDWKPGLSGQRSHILATPILAEIALCLYEYTADIAYIKSIFQKLLDFFQSWFTRTHDRDGDLIPEWDQTLQTGFEDLPLFSREHPWSLGMDISTVESPDLCSYLYRECNSLISIAKLINSDQAVDQLEPVSERLKLFVDQSWNEQFAGYLYRDRDSHISPPEITLGVIRGTGFIDVHQEYQIPIRPIMKIESSKEATRPAQIFIHGNGVTGTHRVEQIAANKIRWQLGTGYVTSEYTYGYIEHVEINGIQPDDLVTIYTTNLTSMDQSQLFPLWAGMSSNERAKIVINLTIVNKKKFLSPHGLRTCFDFPGKTKIPEQYFGIYLPWIDMVLKGLIHYGERNKSAEVFTRIMKTVTHIQQNDLAFYQSYHCETGSPLGAKNTITSLIPIGLFLDIVGIKIINSSKLELTGHNPFPWPVTIKYQGLTVIKHDKKTLVIFPDGNNLTLNNNQYHQISRENSIVTINSA